MELHLDGQHVLIVGGGSGIGWAIAREFVNEGCHVSILDRQPPSQEKRDQLSISAVDHTNLTDVGHRYLLADVTDDQAMTGAFQLLGKLDLSLNHIVYAAGVGSGEFGFPFWNVAP